MLFRIQTRQTDRQTDRQATNNRIDTQYHIISSHIIFKYKYNDNKYGKCTTFKEPRNTLAPNNKYNHGKYTYLKVYETAAEMAAC